MKMSRYLLSLALVAVFGAALVSAGTTTSITATVTAITTALCGIRSLIIGIVPTISLILILLAGLAYAAGQAFGAETKAKAQGWAMSMLVGGIIGILLVIIAPFVVDTFANLNGLKGAYCP